MGQKLSKTSGGMIIIPLGMGHQVVSALGLCVNISDYRGCQVTFLLLWLKIINMGKIRNLKISV